MTLTLKCEGPATNITGAAAAVLVTCSDESGQHLINHEKQQSQTDSTTNYSMVNLDCHGTCWKMDRWV